MTKNTNGLQKRQKPRDLPRTQAVEQEKEKTLRQKSRSEESEELRNQIKLSTN